MPTGCDPQDFDLIVVKSPHTEYHMYDDWVEKNFNIDAPGSTSADLTSLGHTICARPMYPLDEGVTFTAFVAIRALSARSRRPEPARMKIEAVDFFYLAMPRVTTEADGSQDALLVRVAAGGQSAGASARRRRSPSIAAFVCPMSHGVCRPVAASVLGRALDEPDDIARIAARRRI